MNFKQYIRESIINPIRSTFAKNLFDKADTEEPILKQEVKEQIESHIEEFKKTTPILRYVILGGILTKRYRKDSDIDINLLFDIPEKERTKERRLELWDLVNTINETPAIGTEHPINYFPVMDMETFQAAIDKADDAYDIESGKFIKQSKEIVPFKPELYIDKFSKEVKKFDLEKGELDRDIVDYSNLEDLDEGDIKDLNKKVRDKIKEIEGDIKDLIDSKHEVWLKRKAIFSRDLTPEELRIYKIHNMLPDNVIYKLLEKYHYFRLINKLKKIIGDDSKLSKKEVEELK